MHPNATITDFLTRRSQGLSYDKIAKELHVSKNTLLDWAREFRPPIDAKLQSALETYHATLAHRAEALAQQFQTLTQALAACDTRSSNYPRLLNLLLKLHHALQEFDFNPGAPSDENLISTPEHASKLPASAYLEPPPADDPESSPAEPSPDPARTKTAPSSSSRTEHHALSTKPIDLAKTAPESVSPPAIQNETLRRIQAKLNRMEEKIRGP